MIFIFIFSYFLGELVSLRRALDDVSHLGGIGLRRTTHNAHVATRSLEFHSAREAFLAAEMRLISASEGMEDLKDESLSLLADEIQAEELKRCFDTYVLMTLAWFL